MVWHCDAITSDEIRPSGIAGLRIFGSDARSCDTVRVVSGLLDPAGTWISPSANKTSAIQGSGLTSDATGPPGTSGLSHGSTASVSTTNGTICSYWSLPPDGG